MITTIVLIAGVYFGLYSIASKVEELETKIEELKYDVSDLQSKENGDNDIYLD